MTTPAIGHSARWSTTLLALLAVATAIFLQSLPASAQPTITGKPELDPNRLEVGAVPIIMGDSDLGVGVGGVVSLARFRPGFAPFRWQLLAVLFLTMKNEGHGVETVFHNHSIKLDLPDLAGGRLRLQTELAFGRHSNSGYYGMGNAASAIPGEARLHEYDRIYPELDLHSRLKLAGPLSLMAGGRLVYNWVEVYQGSKLAEDLRSNDSYLKQRLRGTGDHFDGVIDVGLLWDTRDQELAPSRGVFHELSFRFTPALGSDVSYAGATLALRYYQSLYRDRLVVAVRLMGDLLVGNPPIYELASYGGLFGMPGPGGGAGIRGVPMQLYHGKVKLISNFELRGRLSSFTVFRQHFNLGAVAFVDAGRVWTDIAAPDRFDGTGLGLKVGVGGGLRLQWGEAFLLRADIAWSPDAAPVGFYFNVNHVF